MKLISRQLRKFCHWFIKQSRTQASSSQQSTVEPLIKDTPRKVLTTWTLPISPKVYMQYVYQSTSGIASCERRLVINHTIADNLPYP